MASTIDTRADIAIEFLHLAASGRAQEAMDRFASADFVHHNPWFPADAESLATAMDDNARANPEKSLEVQRTIADGDIVAVHSRVRHAPGGCGDRDGSHLPDRRQPDRELWDVAQEAPATSPNQRGMF